MPCRGRKADGAACRAPEGLIDPETLLSRSRVRRESGTVSAGQGGVEVTKQVRRKGLRPGELGVAFGGGRGSWEVFV